MAGEIVMTHANNKGVLVLPVDSEHNAIFQCLEGKRSEQIENLILTASGGPFRRLPADQLQQCHQGGGPATSDVENGPENHHRFGDALQ